MKIKSLIIITFILACCTSFAEETKINDYLKAQSIPAITHKVNAQSCDGNTIFCGDYISNKIEMKLGKMEQFSGLRLIVKIKLNNRAEIISKEITQKSGNSDFDTYVMNNIDKASPFTKLIENGNVRGDLRTINVALAPHKKVSKPPVIDETELQCSNTGKNCMTYSIKKVFAVLPDLHKYKGLSLWLKIDISDHATILHKQITKSSGNKAFDKYVLSHLSKAAPFTALTSPMNKNNKSLRTIEFGIGPIR